MNHARAFSARGGWVITITFNAQQQDLILDLLDAERRKNPRLEWFFEDARDEPVIVKNLENIQGDERDVMLFSITFGKDLAGKLTMNFGAINQSTRRYLRRRAKRIRIEDSQQKGSSICSFSSSPL